VALSPFLDDSVLVLAFHLHLVASPSRVLTHNLARNSMLTLPSVLFFHLQGGREQEPVPILSDLCFKHSHPTDVIVRQFRLSVSLSSRLSEAVEERLSDLV
jgi:hypothetical protein